MKKVEPFRALRYDTSKVGSLGRVLAPPYDVISPADAEALRERSQRNIVRVTLPEGEGREKYAGAASILAEWISEGSLISESTPSLYLHRHHFQSATGPRARTGLWGLLRLVPLDEGTVLPHEQTMKGPKADRLALMKACRAQSSPIFFICSDPGGVVSEAMQGLAGSAPDEADEFPAGERHEVWRLSDEGTLADLSTLLDDQVFLIADGHHRYETALAYREELITQGAPEGGDGHHHYVLAYIVPEGDSGLSLEPTHRVLLGNGAVDWKEILEDLAAASSFRVHKLSEAEVEGAGPLLDGELGKASFVFVARDQEGGWLLEPPAGATDIPAVALHEMFLDSVPGWTGPVEGRVAFERNASDAVREVRSGGAQAAALLAPSAVAQIREAARAGRRLPPKTTYFQPKVPTGIAIHRIQPSLSVSE